MDAAISAPSPEPLPPSLLRNPVALRGGIESGREMITAQDYHVYDRLQKFVGDRVPSSFLFSAYPGNAAGIDILRMLSNHLDLELRMR